MKSRYINRAGCRLAKLSSEKSDACVTATNALAQTRNSLFEEYRAEFQADGRLLNLALNEAEALAWQTDFPYLVFPLLAAEKAKAILAWDKRQSAIYPIDHGVALAA